MKAKKSGFTLIEILIVVVILGILAAIVIPQFTDASDQARENSSKTNLSALRSQIELYKHQEGALPANLAALVTDGYLQAIPTDPANDGAAYNYTAETGVVTSGADSDW